MSSDVDPLVEAVVARLRARGESLSCAESCTGGVLSSLLAALAGVSDVFVGSVVAYSNEVKEDLLGVPESLIETVGAVSLPVARSMAQGVRNALSTSWSLSITGIAGPGGGTAQKPVGTVCFGISGPGVEFAEQHHFEGSRREIQMESSRHALRLLLEHLGLDE